MQSVDSNETLTSEHAILIQHKNHGSFFAHNNWTRKQWKVDTFKQPDRHCIPQRKIQRFISTKRSTATVLDVHK